jgi:hypothetical protein
MDISDYANDQESGLIGGFRRNLDKIGVIPQRLRDR